MRLPLIMLAKNIIRIYHKIMYAYYFTLYRDCCDFHSKKIFFRKMKFHKNGTE